MTTIQTSFSLRADFTVLSAAAHADIDSMADKKTFTELSRFLPAGAIAVPIDPAASGLPAGLALADDGWTLFPHDPSALRLRPAAGAGPDAGALLESLARLCARRFVCATYEIGRAHV